jgi:hypothetical protein
MTMPPQPGPWPPSGQPPVPPQGPPPGYYPQQPGWGGPPPPKQNNTIKWLLIGVGLLLVIAITVGVTVLVTNSGNGGNGPSTTTSASGPPIASADDTGPVAIITSEPTCQAWMPASSALTQVQKNGWGDRDTTKSSSEWTSEERAQYDAVADSLRETATQAVEFARDTPHRVMREVYEQFIYFARAYADSVPTYTEKDNYLAQANIAASIVVDSVCNAITYGSAGARSTSAEPVAAPDDPTTPGNPDDPQRVVSEASTACNDLIDLRKKLGDETREWVQEDPNIPSSEWSPERKALSEKTALSMNTFADSLQEIGSKSGHATFEDIASFGSVYVRAYSNALQSYVGADNDLILAGSRANNLLIAACQSASE